MKIDLTGKRFGRLLVVSKQAKRQEIVSRECEWLCICDCGMSVIARSVSLRYGKKKSCGCLQRESRHTRIRKKGIDNPLFGVESKKLIDLTGLRFGRLFVIEKRQHPKYSTAYWWCECDCGAEKLISSSTLRSGNGKSCGCLNKELRIEAWRQNGSKASKWKGGRFTSKNGYVSLYTGPGQSRIPEHRLVMEEHIGRPLLKKETVHHKNGVRNDNRIENLELWSKSHPSGQRVEDKVAWAVELLKLYNPEVLK